ncbi:hypothetical protein NE237_026976 [Protea cynaroides]|uniref:FAD-binding domain-containing protein n=1 Tax=Protea cynaroides TaxID=273540 RepID=A0A9Q0GMN7_9MAGN|nr:hypothetical protein NE237_026976 [Protea cynaroides]
MEIGKEVMIAGGGIAGRHFTNVANGATQEVSLTEINGTSNGPVILHRKALLETLAGELTPSTIRFSSKHTSIRTIAIEEVVSSSIAILSLDDETIIKAKGVMEYVQWLPTGWDLELAPVNSGRDCSRPELLQKDVVENLAKDFLLSYLEVIQHADLATLTWAQLKFRYQWDLIFGHVCKGNITVTSDAMHPMTQDLGQGGCSAFEDVVVFGRHMAKSLLPNRHGHIMAVEAARAIQGHVKGRKWRAAGLITGSYLGGWIQQDGSRCFRKFLRDIFYRFPSCRVLNVQHDCGKLSSVSLLSESDV